MSAGRSRCGQFCLPAGTAVELALQQRLVDPEAEGLGAPVGDGQQESSTPPTSTHDLASACGPVVSR
ncbi:MAG TPA: hypothetical protein VLW50_16455 [Streptosporangiaceae bacterium]|nr:hypothetical protein [Streptosporangiaceae bacterium]